MPATIATQRSHGRERFAGGITAGPVLPDRLRAGARLWRIRAGFGFGGQQLKLSITSLGMDGPVRPPEEETGAHRPHRVRANYQRDMPWIRKVTVVNFEVLAGKQDFAARVGMVPADRLPLLQQCREARMIVRGKRE